MNKKGIGVGIFLIVVGLLVFSMQMGIFSWSVLRVFTNHVELTISLILIVVGINIVLKKYPFVKVVTWLLFFAVMIAYGHYADENIEKNINDNDQIYVIEHNSKTEKGELKIKASALNLIIGSTESNLIDGMVKNLDIEHTVDYKNDNKTVNVKFETNDKKVFQNFFETLLSTGEISVDRKCNLNVNSNIVWNVNMKIDATDSDMDFTDLKVNKLDIDGAAGSFKLILGQKYEDTKVQIDADASKVEIFVPIESGVRVKVDGAASSTNFRDIEMQREGSYYLSKNYKKAQNKIDIDAEMNAGSLKINGIKE